MRLNKTNRRLPVLVLTALALTACGSTAAPSATPIKVIEVPVMPAPPAALLVPPVRPAPPESGTVKALLEHAADFGGYTAELENQNAAWREWAFPPPQPSPASGGGGTGEGRP